MTVLFSTLREIRAFVNREHLTAPDRVKRAPKNTRLDSVFVDERTKKFRKEMAKLERKQAKKRVVYELHTLEVVRLDGNRVTASRPATLLEMSRYIDGETIRDMLEQGLQFVKVPRSNFAFRASFHELRKVTKKVV